MVKIKKLITKSGEEINIGQLTILVGPNNVGKSQVLRDIRDKFETGKQAKTTLIKEIDYEDVTYDELIKTLSIEPHPTILEQETMRGIDSMLAAGINVNVRKDNLKSCFEGNPPKPNWEALIQYQVLKLKIALLNAETRLQIASQKGSKSRKNPPENLLQDLFDKRLPDNVLGDPFKVAFNKEIKFDYSDQQILMFRVAEKFDTIPPDIRDAGPIMEQYRILDNEGDGFRSFVGVVLALLLSEDRVILIDEPEAFLHPIQARVLGNFIANHSKSSDTQVILATHSSNVLDGILAGGQDVEIFRMNRKSDNTKFTKISSTITKQLAQSPLLSSQPIQESIFYEGVVVCEGDSDRCIYETVYSKEFDEKSILFVHAYNKQTIGKVVKILKQATVPVCAVTDMDIINSESELDELLHCFDENLDTSQMMEVRSKIAKTVNGISEKDILSKLKNSVKQFFDELNNDKHDLSGSRSALKRIRDEASAWEDVKKKGINGLPNGVKNEAESLLENTKQHDLFIVPVGELESWIDVGTSIKKNWIIKALEMLEEGTAPDPLSTFVKGIVENLKK